MRILKVAITLIALPVYGASLLFAESTEQIISSTTAPLASPIPRQLVNMVPQTLSGETAHDSEPFLAVDVSDPQRMIASAFTPNPNKTENDRAPVYFSDDGGETWQLYTIIPSPGMTSDITVAGSKKLKRLHAGILKSSLNLVFDALRADDFSDQKTLMSVRTSRGDVDQPYVQAKTVGNADRVYIGSNDLGLGKKSAALDISLDDGNTYRRIAIETRSTAGQNAPSIRPAISASDDTVYVAFFGWRKFEDNVATSDIVVMRDDQGGLGTSPFQMLTDPSDGLAGRLVVTGVTIPWSNDYTLGCERIGSSLSLAVDPTNSSIVYIAWGDRIGNGDIYSIHVRRSTDRGKTWSSDLKVIKDSSPFSLSIAANGTVGLLYQQFVDTGTGQRWKTHLLQTKDAFSSTADTLLADVPNGVPPCGMLPYLGDYNDLVAVGDEFRGVFSASNQPILQNFPFHPKYQRKADFQSGRLLDDAGNAVNVSIDPFYFAVPALQ